MKVAVLALQGAFVEHEKMLEELGAEHFQIRQKQDLNREFDGIIIPGGESTVMAKLLKDLDLFDDIKGMIQKGMPVFGTCAGLILLSKEIKDEETYGFGTMNIVTRRNAYGRQLGSFYTETDFKGIGKVPMTFIRAPYILETGENVEVLATADNNIVAARQGNQLVTAFHPELTNDLRVHSYFLDMISKRK